MLKGESIKSFRVINRGQDRCRPPVFQVPHDLVPHFDEQVCRATTFDTPILVHFSADLSPGPVKHVRFVNLVG